MDFEEVYFSLIETENHSPWTPDKQFYTWLNKLLKIALTKNVYKCQYKTIDKLLIYFINVSIWTAV